MFTKEQVAGLKLLILAAKAGTDLSKKVMMFLVDKSESLTKDVCVTLIENRDGYTADELREAASGVKHVMRDLNWVFSATKNEFVFMTHYGDFDPLRGDKALNSDGMFAGGEGVLSNPDPDLFKKGMPMRYTFWFAEDGYFSKNAVLMVTSHDELELIDTILELS